jgi:CRP/FNR family transcriptional regulator
LSGEARPRGGPETELVARYPGLAGLDPAGRARLLAAAVPVSFAAGRTLFHAGAACEGYLLVLEGSLRVSLLGEGGHEILLYRVGPGESCVLTTTCLLGGQTYPAEGVVEEPVRGLLLPVATVEALLDASPAFRRFALAQIGERLAELLTLVSEVAFRRMDARLAAWLAERGARQGPSLKVTHEAIARELGTAREVVSRLLKELERRGLLRLGRGTVELRPDAFRTLGRLAGRDVAPVGDEVTDAGPRAR